MRHRLAHSTQSPRFGGRCPHGTRLITVLAVLLSTTAPACALADFANRAIAEPGYASCPTINPVTGEVAFLLSTPAGLFVTERNGSSWTSDSIPGWVAAGALAVSSDGQPHTAYADPTLSGLLYAYRDGSGWHQDTTRAGYEVSGATLVMEPSTGRAGVAYRCRWYGSGSWHNDLDYSYRRSNGTWGLATIDAGAGSSTYPAHALLDVGADRVTRVVYLRQGLSDPLRVAILDTATTSFSYETLTEPNGTSIADPTVAYDPGSGGVQVAFTDWYDQRSRVRVARKVAGQWTYATVDSCADCTYDQLRLRIDSGDGTRHLAYAVGAASGGGTGFRYGVDTTGSGPFSLEDVHACLCPYYQAFVAACDLVLDGTRAPAVVYTFSVSDTTSALIAEPGMGDHTAPAAVGDLAVELGRSSAVVSWHDVGDDSLSGKACRVRIRYSTSAITESNFFTSNDTIPMPWDGGRPGAAGPSGTPHCVKMDAGSLAGCTTYYFALKTVDDAGNWSALSNVVSGKTRCSGTMEVECVEDDLWARGGDAEDDGGLAQFKLHASKPNPFTRASTIRFDLPVATSVRLEIYDPQGRRVTTLASGTQAAGSHMCVWHGNWEGGGRARPGVYLCRFQAGNFTAQSKVVLLP